MEAHHIFTDETLEAGEVIVSVHPATPEGIGIMFNAEVDTGNGRSRWVWIRFTTGELVFGCFPQGDTYMDVTDADAHYIG